MKRGAGTAGAVGLAVLVAAVWYLRLATPEDVRSARTTDLRTYFLPTYMAFYGWLARGTLLGWNPFQACGTPWLGTLQAGFFYPPHAVYLVLPAHRALLASAAGHVVLATLGTAAFARRLGLGVWAAGVAAMLFALHGVFASWLAWPYMLEASAWLPLGCVAVHRCATDGDARATALLATALGMSWLAGSPQATVFLVYGWASLLVVLVAARGPRDARAWISAGLAFAAALGLGTAAGMAALAPGRELAVAGSRAAEALDVASMFPIGYGATAWHGVVAVGGLAGFTALGWSLAPLAIGTRTLHAVLAWAVALIVLTVCFVFGPTYSLVFALYRALPLLAWFRSPFRIIVLGGFAFAVLAGVGTEALLRATAAGARGLRLLALSLPAAFLVVRGHATAGGLAAAVAMASLVRDGRAASALGAVVLALAALEVPRFPGALPYDAASGAQYHARDALYERLAAIQGDGRVWFAADQLAPGVVPRLATLHGVRSFSDYEPLLLQRQAEYLRALYATPGEGIAPAPLEWVQHPQRMAERARLLDLAAVRWVVLPGGPSRGLGEALQARGMRAADSGDPKVVLLENPRALPRAYVTYRTLAPPPVAALLDRLDERAFDPLHATFVEGSAANDAAAPEGHAATIVVDEPGRVEVDAAAATNGWLVLADTFAPGWTASVDGHVVPISAANHLFRAVPLEAGRHRVRFEYRSRALALGVGMSAVGWAAIAVVGARARARP